MAPKSKGPNSKGTASTRGRGRKSTRGRGKRAPNASPVATRSGTQAHSKTSAAAPSAAARSSSQHTPTVPAQPLDDVVSNTPETDRIKKVFGSVPSEKYFDKKTRKRPPSTNQRTSTGKKKRKISDESSEYSDSDESEHSDSGQSEDSDFVPQRVGKFNDEASNDEKSNDGDGTADRELKGIKNKEGTVARKETNRKKKKEIGQTTKKLGYEMQEEEVEEIDQRDAEDHEQAFVQKKTRSTTRRESYEEVVNLTDDLEPPLGKNSTNFAEGEVQNLDSFLGIDTEREGAQVQSSSEIRYYSLDGERKRVLPFHFNLLEGLKSGFLADGSVDYLATIHLKPQSILEEYGFYPSMKYKWVYNSEDTVHHLLQEVDKKKTPTKLSSLRGIPHAAYWRSIFEADLILLPMLVEQHWSLICINGSRVVFKLMKREKSVAKIRVLHLDSLRDSSHYDRAAQTAAKSMAIGIHIISSEDHDISTIPYTQTLSWMDERCVAENNEEVIGQQNRSDANCGWWLALNARYILLKECGKSVNVPRRNEIERLEESIRKSVQRLRDQPAQQSQFGYNIPDMLRCTRKFLDEAIIAVGDVLAPGVDGSKAEKNSTKRKAYAVDKLKRKNFCDNDVAMKVTNKERKGLAEILLPSMRHCEMIFNAMNLYKSSTLLYSGVRTLLFNQGNLKKSEDGTIKGELCHIWKLFDCSCANTQADTITLSPKARISCIELSVHFIALAEACLLALHPQSKFNAGSPFQVQFADPLLYQCTTSSIRKNMSDEQGEDMDSNLFEKEISLLFVTVLSTVHNGMKYGLRSFRKRLHVSPASVIKGGEAIRDESMDGVPDEFISCFLGLLFVEVTNRNPAPGFDAYLTNLLSYFLFNFQNRRNSSFQIAGAKQKAEELMKKFWTERNSDKVKNLERKGLRSDRNHRKELDVSEFNPAVDEFRSNELNSFPFETWISSMYNDDPSMNLIAIILHFMIFLSNEGIIHERGGGTCKSDNRSQSGCIMKAIRAVEQFGSSLTGNEGENLPLFVKMKGNGENYMNDNLQWLIMDTLLDFAFQGITVCTPSAQLRNGFDAAVVMHGETRQVNWVCTTSAVKKLSTASPSSYNGWVSADGKIWGVGNISFPRTREKPTLYSCDLEYKVPLTSSQTPLFDEEGNLVQIEAFQLIRFIHKSNDAPLLGMVTSAPSPVPEEMGSYSSSNTFFKLSALIISSPDFSVTEDILNNSTFYSFKMVDLEEPFRIFKGLSMMNSLPSTLTTSLHDPSKFLSDHQAFLKFSCMLDQFKDMKEGNQNPYPQISDEKELASKKFSDLNDALNSTSAYINCPLSDIQKKALYHWTYALTFKSRNETHLPRL